MRIDVLTLFPEMFEPLKHSILGKALDSGIITLNLVNIRDFSKDKHKKADDYPYGGGPGMVMMVQPVVDAIREVKKINRGPVIFLGPKGKVFKQETASRLSKVTDLILLCGHYEGIDERIYSVIDEEISIGDFILTGGEMAAIPIIDSIVRLIPGVLGTDSSSEEESFSDGTLEYPQYTRPEVFEDMTVPEILLSGHHENIRKWRRYKSLEATRELRPDLYSKLVLTKEDQKIISKIDTISSFKGKRPKKENNN